MTHGAAKPEYTRLVAMLRAMGEDVPEELLEPEATPEEIVARVSGVTKEAVEAVLAEGRRWQEFKVSNKYPDKGVKSAGETWTLEMDISFRDADESNEPDYLPPVRKPKYVAYNGIVTIPKF